MKAEEQKRPWKRWRFWIFFGEIRLLDGMLRYLKLDNSSIRGKADSCDCVEKIEDARKYSGCGTRKLPTRDAFPTCHPPIISRSADKPLQQIAQAIRAVLVSEMRCSSSHYARSGKRWFAFCMASLPETVSPSIVYWLNVHLVIQSRRMNDPRFW